MLNMTQVIAVNKSRLRAGKFNMKLHVDMTEEEKAKVAKCKGMKDGHVCKNPIFRCDECGNYGCAQTVPDRCEQQGFKNDKCLHCGAVDSRIPVMEDELAQVIAEWEKEVPAIEG